VHGKHNKVKGIYWLVTHDGDKYWPQCRIRPHQDGNWAERVNVGPVTNQKPCFLILAWASDLINAVSTDYKERGRRTNDWGPMTLKPTKRDMQVVQEVILTVVKQLA
jgi:hypothetical protein